MSAAKAAVEAIRAAANMDESFVIMRPDMQISLSLIVAGKPGVCSAASAANISLGKIS